MQFNEAIKNQLLTEVDYLLFQAKARDILQATQGVESLSKWQLFCKNLDLLTNEDKPTRLMLMRVALFCFANPISSIELAQFITLSMHVKSSCGLSMYGLLFQAKTPSQDSKIQDYLTILELLVDLHETVGILKTVKSCLPNLLALKETLLLLQAEALAIKYPKRDIDVILKRFCQADDLVLFPLQQEVVISFKQDYLAIVAGIQKLTAVPQEELKLIFIKYGNIWRTEQDCIAKQKLIAVMAETVRRCYKILPYDTQILSLLALLAVPSNQLKGRIAQIKTGEGKSTIIAMLAAFMGTQGYFVDLITSSGYLAMRDCEKYSNFFTVLGLTSSHISYQTPKQEYFHAQILYGTNADFEFALLRDGLNKNKLRYSFPLGSTELQLRSFDVVLIDEVDNMLLDVTGSARMSIPGNEDLVFIYPAVLQFVASNLQDAAITSEVIGSLRDHLINTLDQQKHTEIYTLTEAKLTRWLNSAKIALYHKKENRDYLVKEDIVIVDYVNTGRTVDGSQWQHSIHQFLQAKHNLKITPAALTGASVSHPTYFSAYQKIFGLTGTMGEPIERQEVEEIYQIDSFDVPPHFHSKRETLEPSISPTPAEQSFAILQLIKQMQALERPTLILFESIEESEDFSKFLHENRLMHQLLNETQREAEDYIIARAGEARMITVATNTAGRGTDIILSPESKSAGGLHMIFAFYPENLRVEGQGFGRAGRQGQPGSCCMILHAMDRQILTLLPPHNTLLLTKNIANKFTIEQIKQLRTNKIQHESNRRRNIAQLESLYFVSLNNFFSQLQTLRIELERPELQVEMEKICTSPSKITDNLLGVKINNPILLAVYHDARNLMQVKNTTSTMNKNLNYSFLIRTFKESFLEYTLNTWAGFYSKIVDRTANMLIIDAENYINNEYMRENIDFLCSIAYCKELFSYILQQASLPEEIDFARKENVNLLFKFPSYLHDKSGENRSQYRPVVQQPTSASLVVAKNTNLEQLCPQVNLPQIINLARSTEVNSSFKLLQSLHDEENSDLTQFTHIDNQPTITNAEPTQVKQVNVNQQGLNEFLRLVAEGEQDAAELISTQNSDLLLVSGDVTDLSGRKFNNITGFQYAVWALDSHMWNMMLRSKNFPRNAIKQQLEGMATGSWVAEHGVSASWQNLIDALGLYINLCHNISSWKEATNQWNKVVGSAQRLLPAHVINEYCHATLSFDPCPNFENAEAISRSRKTSCGDWFTCSYLSGVLGEDFAMCRSGNQATPCRVMSAGALKVAIIDQIACRNMLAAKIKLREEIFDEFIGVLDICYGKSILGI